MTDVFEPSLMTTGIGSVPLADPDAGAAFVLDADVSIPFWPQLPKRGFREQIIPQYAEAMPCVTIDVEAERTVLEPGDRHTHLHRFYEAYLSEDLEPFALSSESAAGFGALTCQSGSTTPSRTPAASNRRPSSGHRWTRDTHGGSFEAAKQRV